MTSPEITDDAVEARRIVSNILSDFDKAKIGYDAVEEIVSALTAALAAGRAEAGAAGWQTMDTAPKDGTRVLLWRRAIRDQPTPIMADGFWCETCWVWPYLLSEPTHWQPLPTPPERAGK